MLRWFSPGHTEDDLTYRTCEIHLDVQIVVTLCGNRFIPDSQLFIVSPLPSCINLHTVITAPLCPPAVTPPHQITDVSAPVRQRALGRLHGSVTRLPAGFK